MHTADQSLALPIPTAARQTADQFSAQQVTPEKAEQVRLNTLAVWTAHNYLQMMGISCALESSDSWNPVVRACINVADLSVASGRLECRPIRSNAKACHLPPEVCDDRIGYLLVEITDDLRQAKLLGFTPTAGADLLSVSQLSPLESLLAHLSEFSLTQPLPHANHWHQIEQWLNGVVTDGWHAVDTLLGSSEPAFSFRRAETIDPQIVEGQVQQAKLISLPPEASPMVLVVDCKPDQEQRLFCVQVHPLASDTYLPTNLQLTVVDDTAQPLLKAKSRHADNYIQLQFSGDPGERFSLTVMLGESSVTEKFII